MNYSELCALTQLYIFENFSKGDKCFVSKENAQFFASSPQKKTVVPIVPVVQTPPPAPLPVPEPKKEKEIGLTKYEKTESPPNSDLLDILKEVAPNLSFLPPPTHEAFPQIAILHLGETPIEARFLHHIATAINICFKVSCKVVEAHHTLLNSSTTRLLLAAECRLTDMIKESKIPLLPLPDLSLQMQNPTLKKSLWSTICQHIARHAH